MTYELGGLTFYDPNGNMTEDDAVRVSQEFIVILRHHGWKVRNGGVLNGKPLELPAVPTTA